MFAEIITIGDEILIGQVVDTNSAYIAKCLNKIGVSVHQVTSVQDQSTHIKTALQEAESRADIIIVTGGLGPTKDDVTKKTFTEYFEDQLVRDASVTKNINRLWKQFNQTPSQLNLDQALVPSKAQVLMNLHGSAPGMWFDKAAKTIISLPGVPFEMKALMTSEVMPRLQKRYRLPFIQHKTILTHGIGESKLAEMIASWEDALPSFIHLAYLPNFGRVRLRLSAKSDNGRMIEQAIKQHVELLMPLIKDYFVGFEDEGTIDAVIGNHLAKMQKTVAVAESCTGGKIAASFTAIAGASRYFKGGVVCYATESKIKILGVRPELIEQFSVVSKEVAEAMAQSARALFETDYALATTGNAGPTKGDSEAEVGTVCIALATKTDVFSEIFNFGDHREKVVQRATAKALEMLHKEILKK
ncbi:MAG TPA: competence/damage-inducible protein A [Aquaticitalea sp.]|nr:competence/damage-inducible protein A [Aquaticitalea sp.]